MVCLGLLGVLLEGEILDHLVQVAAGGGEVIYYPQYQLRQVLWNFHKFLVDDQGRWLGNYGSKTSPLDVDLTSFAYEDGH